MKRRRMKRRMRMKRRRMKSRRQKKGGWAKEEDSDRRELSQAASAAIPQRRTLSLAYFFSILTNTFQYLDDMQIQYLCHIFLPSQLNAFLNPLFQAGSDKRSGHWSPFHRPWNFDTLFVFQLLYLCICALNCIVFARLVSQQSGYRSPFAPRPLVTFAAQTLEQLALALRRLHCIVFCSSSS